MALYASVYTAKPTSTKVIKDPMRFDETHNHMFDVIQSYFPYNIDMDDVTQRALAELPDQEGYSQLSSALAQDERRTIGLKFMGDEAHLRG